MPEAVSSNQLPLKVRNQIFKSADDLMTEDDLTAVPTRPLDLI